MGEMATVNSPTSAAGCGGGRRFQLNRKEESDATEGPHVFNRQTLG